MAWPVDGAVSFAFAVGLESCLTADVSVLRIICFDAGIDGVDCQLYSGRSVDASMVPVSIRQGGPGVAPNVEMVLGELTLSELLASG